MTRSNLYPILSCTKDPLLKYAKQKRFSKKSKKFQKTPVLGRNLFLEYAILLALINKNTSKGEKRMLKEPKQRTSINGRFDRIYTGGNIKRTTVYP